MATEVLTGNRKRYPAIQNYSKDVNHLKEVLPLEDAVVLLRQAEEERAEADRALEEVLRTLGLLKG